MKLFLKSKRKIQKLLAGGLLAIILTVSFAPVSTVMAAEVPVEVSANTTQESELPTELTSSYFQLASDTVMPRSTTYFIHDQQFSFRGTYITYPFNVPSACQARLVIAPIGNEPLYIDVLNGRYECESSMTATPNQSQVKVFNINSGTHYLQFSSITGSQFTIRMQMYTWEY